MTPVLSFALLLTIALSAGCGGEPGGSMTSSASGGGSATATTGSPNSPSPRASGYLQRHDVPPAGVEKQLFGFFGQPAPPCSDVTDDAAAVIIDSSPVSEVPGGVLICLPGFATRPIQVEVERPDGIARARSVGPSISIPYLTWYAIPGDPVGEYRVIARQGAVEATGSFRVREASKPRVLAIPPDTGPPGTTFRLVFGGFPPASSVDIYVYVAERDMNRWTYVTALPPAVLDKRGEGTYEIRTAAGDPAGEYCVTYRANEEPAHDACDASFIVAS